MKTRNLFKLVIVWVILLIALLEAGLSLGILTSPPAGVQAAANRGRVSDVIDHTQGSVYYVRSGAVGTGQGLNWTDAYTNLPATLERGATYYLAAGDYFNYSFDDPEVGDSYIYIQKATKSEHGTDEGWQPTYGEGPARFNSIFFATGRYVFDGATGSGTEGYGFDIYNTNPPEDNMSSCIETGSISNLVIRHTEAHRPSIDYKGVIFSGQSMVSNLTVSDCYFHDVFGAHFYFVGGSNFLIEHSIMARNKNTADWHSESIQARGVTGLTVRNSIFEDIQGTGVIVSGSGNSADWKIYGNVFNATSVAGWTASWSVTDNFNDSITNVYFYNNTVHLPGVNVYGGVQCSQGAGDIVVSNNIFKDCSMVYFNLQSSGRTERSYNDFVNCTFGSFSDYLRTGERAIEGQVFVDEINKNFHLLAETASGITLSFPYTIDPDGYTRGGDGNWDRGAYEFVPSLDLRGASADKTIYLDWTVNVTLPVTTTWKIDYYTTTTTAPFTATDLISTTRSFTLTEHAQNYQWYTVTLYAMLGETPWLSDTVHVMPTDRFVYLPLVLK